MKQRADGKKDQSERSEALNWLLTFIFRKAFPIWKQFEGAVPGAELERFDERWDLPRGAAEAAMSRISRDGRLRRQLHDLEGC
jgi:hypothetical protein